MTLSSQNCSAKVLLLTNFSGFLGTGKNWKKAEDKFDELFRHSRDDNSVVLWIEPKKNNVINENGFFPRMTKWFKKQFDKLIRKDKETNEFSCSSANVKHPLMTGTFRTNMVIVQLDLPLNKKS